MADNPTPYSESNALLFFQAGLEEEALESLRGMSDGEVRRLYVVTGHFHEFLWKYLREKNLD